MYWDGNLTLYPYRHKNLEKENCNVDVTMFSPIFIYHFIQSDDECKHEILTFENGELEDAVVCHCTENLCNYRTPVVPGTSTEQSKTTSDKNGATVQSSFYGLLFHILFWAGILPIF